MISVLIVIPRNGPAKKLRMLREIEIAVYINLMLVTATLSLENGFIPSKQVSKRCGPSMKATGVVCVWLGLCCSPLYAQHLPKVASLTPEVKSQPATSHDSPLAAAPITSDLNLPNKALE